MTLAGVGIIPTVVVSILYYALFPDRMDYVGHYAAGYGGTLSALAVALSQMPPVKYEFWAKWVIIPGVLLCIGGGTITEATVFRLAKFDEVDYCNQNIGAVLAGLVALHLIEDRKPLDNTFAIVAAIGFVMLVAGAYFALS